MRSIIAAGLICLATTRLVFADDPHSPAPPETFKPAQLEHWAFQPLSNPIPPAVKRQGEVQNPIDAFILAELEAIDLDPRRPPKRRRCSVALRSI